MSGERGHWTFFVGFCDTTGNNAHMQYFRIQDSARRKAYEGSGPGATATLYTLEPDTL